MCEDESEETKDSILRAIGLYQMEYTCYNCSYMTKYQFTRGEPAPPIIECIKCGCNTATRDGKSNFLPTPRIPTPPPEYPAPWRQREPWSDAILRKGRINLKRRTIADKKDLLDKI